MNDPYAATIIPTAKRVPYFESFLAPAQTLGSHWFWRLKSATGEVLALSEPHVSREACLAVITQVKTIAASAEIR